MTMPDNDSGSLLQVRGVSKHFGGVVAVADVSFDIMPRTATSIVGPNGAGKTTLFNLITGALRPDAGSVTFAGRAITARSPSWVARQGISRTFQDLRLFGGMTVVDNVMASFQGQAGEVPFAPFARFATVRRQESAFRRRAHEILDRVGLANRAEVLAVNLSYAEQKLVVIARAIAMEAPLWLLDEPTSGLDSKGVDDITTLVRSLAGEGQTVLIIEHNLRVVERMSDHVLFMVNGRLAASGSYEEIFANEELRRVYLGEMATADGGSVEGGVR